ncbi:MAG: TatD family hydrolase [Succinivibrio sp.]
MLYDAHIHAGLYPDIKALVECAHSHDITLLCNSCTLEESERTVRELSSISCSFPVFAGIHPWYVSDEHFDESRLAHLAKNSLIAGIGECGLDFKASCPHDRQIECLDRQMHIAKLYSLPLNLHVRSAHPQLISLLKSYQGGVRGIIHNFTFSYELAREYLNLGFILSVGHHILNISPKLRSVLLKAGLDGIVLETDADYYHSASYDPQQIKNEYECLGRLFNLKMEELESRVEQNILKILGK